MNHELDIPIYLRDSNCGLLDDEEIRPDFPKDALAYLKKGALLVDVRIPGEFNSGHLPAVINIPLGEIET